MRTDLDSLNPGKAMAQAAHAANQFAFEFKGNEFLERWEAETGFGFGTTIVLAIEDEADLNYYTSYAEDMGLPNGITHDPSYPIRDGKVTHLLPLDTCGYIFSDTGPLEFLKKLSLHP
jgi:peptidyl-tRNA hydrolase